MTPHHVEVDLSRFDASGKPEYISLMEEEDDLKVEETLEDEDEEGGGTKGKTASAKKKRERKVSWNDSGISRFVSNYAILLASPIVRISH